MTPQYNNQHPIESEGNHHLIKSLLSLIGEDSERDGLKNTPLRVLKAWKELTAGYWMLPKEILTTTFDSGQYDQMILCPWIEFYSTCEHHMLPFFGYAHVAYFPDQANPRVVGLSKLARTVECYARRLQIQERLTMEVASALREHLLAKDVAVVVQAKHLCMACRGVQKHKAVMVTSAMHGRFRDSESTRMEFFQLVELAKHSNGS
jgi:GTP cyclohydrolase I